MRSFPPCWLHGDLHLVLHSSAYDILFFSSLFSFSPNKNLFFFSLFLSICDPIPFWHWTCLPFTPFWLCRVESPSLGLFFSSTERSFFLCLREKEKESWSWLWFYLITIMASPQDASCIHLAVALYLHLMGMLTVCTPKTIPCSQQIFYGLGPLPPKTKNKEWN